MTPTDQTSTLEEILGGSFPTTKHSGGKYLQRQVIEVTEIYHVCLATYTRIMLVVGHKFKSTLSNRPRFTSPGYHRWSPIQVQSEVDLP